MRIIGVIMRRRPGGVGLPKELFCWNTLTVSKTQKIPLRLRLRVKNTAGWVKILATARCHSESELHVRLSNPNSECVLRLWV